MERIAFCIPSKNNLAYLKLCIPSIRENAYIIDHEIIVFVDQDKDGTREWLEENKARYDITVYYNPTEKLYGIGKAYDFCIEKSTTDIFMIFHADMVLGMDADLEMFRLLEKGKTVVCATRVEPPLHPNNGEKITRNFGIWPEEFNKQAFADFDSPEPERVTDGIFAPWMMYKEDFWRIGGHDPILKSAREDSDVFNRLSLTGFEFKQSWNALVYHFTGRGGQFQHGQVGEEKDKEWELLMQNSTREFIRKWGSNVLHTPMMKPIVLPRYSRALVVKNCTPDLLYLLEPWGDKIYSDYSVLEDYIQSEPSAFALEERVLPLSIEPTEDIIVYIDGETFTTLDFEYLQQMTQIVKSGEAHWGKTSKLLNMTIYIKHHPIDYTSYMMAV